MEFRLFYWGNQLSSSGKNAMDQHAIRKQFHPQLKRLWESNPKLIKLAEAYGHAWVTSVDAEQMSDQNAARRKAFFRRMGEIYHRGYHHFIPLVTEDLCLRVALDILFLRPDSLPLIQKSGDIDNRLKTLFDALRVPSMNVGMSAPEPDEEPFYVLLQDDNLISDIRVTTDNLLLPPHGRELNAKDAFLEIHVKLAIAERVAKSWAFE